jgi:hypothetical protein
MTNSVKGQPVESAFNAAEKEAAWASGMLRSNWEAGLELLRRPVGDELS